jgi:hypothetical protein
MHRLEISDLSFYELVNEQPEITGGFFVPVQSLNLYEYLFRNLLNTTHPILDNLKKEEVYSEPGTVISKLEDKQMGVSGYEVLSNDGKSRTVVLSGGSSVQSFSTSSNFSHFYFPLM